MNFGATVLVAFWGAVCCGGWLGETPTTASASIIIRYVDEFGRPWVGCHITEFSYSQGETHLDLRTHFDGMVGRNIPLSDDYYAVRLSCPGALSDGPFYVSVRHTHEFVVISAWNHKGDYHTGLGPRLTVHVAQRSAERGDETWVKITGVYLDFHETDGVHRDSHEARFYQIVPGRYLVLLLTGSKVACTKGIDFLEAGAQLELAASPNGCTAKAIKSVKVLE